MSWMEMDFMYQVRCLNYDLVEDLKQDFVIGNLVAGER